MCLLLVFSVGTMLAISPVGAQGPPLQFEGHDALEAWAGSTPGGGRLYELGPEAPGLFCADRSYTSGVYSSELAVYLKTDDGYALVLYLPFKLGAQRKAWVQDETLVIEERPMGRSEDSVKMKVPLQMLSGI
jgi:hypothetical protein